MKRLAPHFMLCAALISNGVESAMAQEPVRPDSAAVLQGSVYDAASGEPLRLAVVRLIGTEVSVLTDDDGRFQIDLEPGEWHLEIRAFGYENAALTIELDADSIRHEIRLKPLAVRLGEIDVSVTRDRAREIIEQAIARKRDALASVNDFQYDGYVKFAVRDLRKPQDSATSIILITETRSRAYWERPGDYQETILGRRQSSNLDAEQNFVTVGEIVNFNRDRINLSKYSLVSPIADDALEHYDYAILDTLNVEGRRVFRLAVRPRTEATPLFTGMIDISDSTYDVYAIDVGVNTAARFTYISNLRYQQRMRMVAGGRWMPQEIRLSGEVHLAVPLPGFPGHVAFEHMASLDRFRFDGGARPSDLRQVRIVVDEDADDPESTSFEAPAAVRLSPAEQAAWARIDSIARQPPSMGRRIGRAARLLASRVQDPDFVHFNRVDGPYLGAAREWRQPRGTVWTTSLGYGFDSEKVQYRVGGRVQLSKAHDIRAGVTYISETMQRPTFVSADYNASLLALALRLDPHDYFRERGLTVSAAAELVPFTRIELRYHDLEQSSMGVATDYSLFDVTRPQRPNPPIVDGRLRSFSASLGYDSRRMLRSKGVDYRLPGLPMTRLGVTIEVADPDVIENDFRFRRYTAQFERRQRTLNLGTTTLRGTAGVATGALPPQKYFSVDFGNGVAYHGDGFNTMDEAIFAGNRAAMIGFHHDFDRLLFLASGLPLIRSIPFTLNVHGGIFWADFVDHVEHAADAFVLTAEKPYSEIGFGLGNLTPFLSPFNFQLFFTWQLSSYPTNGFQFGFGITP